MLNRYFRKKNVIVLVINRIKKSSSIKYITNCNLDGLEGLNYLKTLQNKDFLSYKLLVQKLSVNIITKNLKIDTGKS